jgi:hypothetical protein
VNASSNKASLDGCDICGGAHTNAEHVANSDADGRYSPPPSQGGTPTRPRLSYLPAMKDKHGNRIIGLMGQYDDRNEAMQKQLADFIWWIPFGLSTDGIVEYDREVGLPNVKMEIMKYECAVISGPEFDRVLQQPSRE